MEKPAHDHPMQQGMHNGMRFGLWLTAFYALSFGSARFPLLSIPALFCLAALPVVLYICMRRDFRASQGVHTVGTLWLNGLLTVIGGALLASVPLVIFLQWIDPQYLPDQWETTVNMLAASDDAQTQHMAAELRQALDNGFEISPIIFTMTMLWTMTFIGSILALILGIVVKSTVPRYTKNIN